MKRIIAFVLVLILLCTPVLAHSGRTDSDGGHYDSTTGEYHYHHGYPAHQHPDGICPYDFNDSTEHIEDYSNYSRSTAETEHKIDVWEILLWIYQFVVFVIEIIGIFPLVLLIVSPIILLISDGIKKIRNKHKQNKTINSYRKK